MSDVGIWIGDILNGTYSLLCDVEREIFLKVLEGCDPDTGLEGEEKCET